MLTLGKVGEETTPVKLLFPFRSGWQEMEGQCECDAPPRNHVYYDVAAYWGMLATLALKMTEEYLISSST